MSDLTCRDLAEFLADYMADELEPDVRASFDDHLARCPSCVVYLNTYRDTSLLAREALQGPRATVPPHVPEALVRAILEARHAVGAGAGRRGVNQPGAVARRRR